MRAWTQIAALATAATLALSGCGLTKSGDDKAVGTEKDGITTLKVGASPVPQADILHFVDDKLAKKNGLKIDVKEYTDYTAPNKALVDGDLDANYFQHEPYYESEVKGQGYDLAHYKGIHIEPFALYSDKVKNVKDLPDGAKIGVNNDPSNQGRALALLEKAKLITLADGKTAADATVHDVKDNPHHFSFVEADAAQLARTLKDVDASVINGNNALEAGLSPKNDGILIEDAKDNPYANFLAVRKADENNEKLKKLDELLHSPEVKKYIEDKWKDGSVLPAF